jgi:holo-[acyl-carrier protein] synthase
MMGDAHDPPLIGIDLVDPERLRERIQRNPGLEQELFLPGELEYCRRQQEPAQHLAARFAAKEAVVKALGIDGFDPLEIEVLAGGEETALLLHGDVAARAASVNVEVRISLTHLPTIAGAVALATPRSPKDT